LRSYAAQTGVSVSDALREGALMYYENKLANTLGGDEDLAENLRFIAAKLDRRIGGKE
jgi:hypothetical protein